MTNEKKSKTILYIDIDALVEERLNVNKEEVRQQILEEQLGELLQSDVIQEATLSEFLEQLKGASKEVWKLVSSMPIVEVARLISGTDRLEERLRRKPRRTRTPRVELDEHKKKVLEILKSMKEAQTIGQIGKGLTLEPYFLKKILVELYKDKLATRQGEKRATRYAAA